MTPADFNLIYVLVSLYWDGLSTSWWYPFNLKYTTMAVSIFLLDFRPYYGPYNKKTEPKYCWWYNFVLLSIMAQSCAIKIHDEMRTISQSMPITLNAPHSIKNADTLETLTRQLCPFKLSCSHRYVAEWVSKCMVEGVSEWVRVTLCWVSRKISDWVNE